MNRLNKTESAIFMLLVCSLRPKGLHSELVFAMYAFKKLRRHDVANGITALSVRFVLFTMCYNFWTYGINLDLPLAVVHKSGR